MITIKIFATLLIFGVFMWRIIYSFYKHDDDFVGFMTFLCCAFILLCGLVIVWHGW